MLISFVKCRHACENFLVILNDILIPSIFTEESHDQGALVAIAAANDSAYPLDSLP
jgi:hypothetical protein